MGNAESPVAVKSIAPEKLFSPCPVAELRFTTTAEITPLDTVVGQDRAVEAICFAIGIQHDGYNIFALGPEGTGKASTVRRYLYREAAKRPLPMDWCYVNNFKEAEKPRALSLPAGRGVVFHKDTENLIVELRGAIPAAFESDEYRQRKESLENEMKAPQEEAFMQLQHRAEERDVALVRTHGGLLLAPVKDGEPIDKSDFEALPEDQKNRRRAAIAELQEELEAIFEQAPKWEKAFREKIRNLNREVMARAVGHLIDELAERWRNEAGVCAYLDDVREDVLDHAAEFMESPAEGGIGFLVSGRHREQGVSGPFGRYRVNLVVDYSGADKKGAPVVELQHPTQPNLMGRIEHISQMGALVTDFNLIRPGALHAANGGYLVIEAQRLLSQPFAWDALKRALRARHIKIEGLAESLGWLPTTSLQPEPIPLDIKVVLLGEPLLYYLLSQYDPDFRELFKVQADFAERMDRAGGAAQYAKLIAGLVGHERLRHLDAAAVGRIVEEGARIAGDGEKLTVHMASVADLVREADYWAGQDNAKTVGRNHVVRAIEAGIRRSDRLRERIQEEIQRGNTVIESEGERVGQVNGLSVIQLDSFSFGRPSRITASVHLGKGEVLDIERQVELGGPLHSKGVMILESFLAARFARKSPITMAARLTFEQSYGSVEGDSASSAELCALLSAIGELPLRQGIAVTGSVDQKGHVQAVGGVNEKIEGFFDICDGRGLSGGQGVIIPAANLKHLMLREPVVRAVEGGRFNVWAVETIDQAMEILTGQAAGEMDARGKYDVGTLNHAVQRNLDRFAASARSFAATAPQTTNTVIKMQPPTEPK